MSVGASALSLLLLELRDDAGWSGGRINNLKRRSPGRERLEVACLILKRNDKSSERYWHNAKAESAADSQCLQTFSSYSLWTSFLVFSVRSLMPSALQTASTSYAHDKCGEHWRAKHSTALATLHEKHPLIFAVVIFGSNILRFSTVKQSKNLRDNLRPPMKAACLRRCRRARRRALWRQSATSSPPRLRAR